MPALNLQRLAGNLTLAHNGGTVRLNELQGRIALQLIVGNGTKGDAGPQGNPGPKGDPGPAGPALPAAQMATLAHSEEAVDLAASTRALRFAGDTVDAARLDPASGATALPGVSVANIAGASGWDVTFENSSGERYFGRRSNGQWVFYGGDLPMPAAFPKPGDLPLVMVGDSLQANRIGYPDAVSAGLLGRVIINDCVGGQLSDQIAGWFGGTPALATVTGNVIPASGAVTVTALSSNIGQHSTLSTGTWTFVGILAGIPGTLTVTETSSGVYTYAFTRTTAGDPAPCPPASPFQTGIKYRAAIPFVRIGRNNFLTTPAATIVSQVQSILAWSRYGELGIVESIPPYNTETLGTANRTTLDATNAALAAAFPRQWLDTAAYVRSTDTLAAMGLTPTTQDTTDLSNGITPTSFRAAGDPLHYNYLAYRAIDRLYQSRLALVAA